MSDAPERDWMVVAPWWRWVDPVSVPGRSAQNPKPVVDPDPLAGRLSAPVFQKYDSPNLVNDFIADPQRCLQFVDDDLVHVTQPWPGPSLGKLGKLLRIGAGRDVTGAVVDQRYVPDGTNTRKVFLNAHKRFYLVVAEVHCDAPGFPKVARAKLCQAGFVIRRRKLVTPGASLAEAKPIVEKLATGRVRLARVTQLAAIEGAAIEATTGTGLRNAKLESLLQARTSLRAVLDAEKARFGAWVERFGVAPTLQGWFPSPEGFDKVGTWQAVDETPSALGAESSFPLYPLIPPKGDPTHAGQYGTVYFGLLPTSSHDCEPTGQARFDDREFYEVRCWALRHRKPHDPDQPCPCPDGIFWSVPTRPYKLASHHDLAGTGNHPVTVQLPDLNDLAAQAKPSFGVGFAKPAGSLVISSDASGAPRDQQRSLKAELCFTPIPLITIIATFVLELFMPVVMFLFQLWWMLALKFCIPSQVELAAGITAELLVDSDESSIDAAALTASLTKGFGPDVTAELTNTYSPIALANLDFDLVRAGKATPGAPSATAGLAFEPEVTHVKMTQAEAARA